VPEISVVIPLYNKSEFVERCVASIRAQTLADFEVVVVDDGSTDDGLEVFRRACDGDPRFHLVQQPNGGVSKARNTGVEHARAGVIAFLDADDEWMPGYLEAIADLARGHPDAPLLATAYRIHQGATHVHGRESLFGGVSSVDAQVFFVAWARLGGCPLFIGATAARRDDLLAVGGFEVGMNLGEELLTFIRLVERGPIAFLDQPLAVYHLALSGSLATSPSPTAIRNHMKLLAALERQVSLGRCPPVVYRRWLWLHAHYLTEAGHRGELLRFLARAPSQFKARQWATYLLELAGVRGPLRRILGRA
jgi:glycosyltransferase involved in cell wall biosynthesis